MNNKYTYIAGKISGENYEECVAKFKGAENTLKKIGLIPINPMNYTTPDMSWKECMRIAIRKLMECDNIYLLPDWEQSKGAKIEHDLAEQLELTIFKIER